MGTVTHPQKTAASKRLGMNARGISVTGQRATNEDRYCIRRCGDAWVLAVADGLGGLPDGEVAAEIAIGTIHAMVAEVYDDSFSPEEMAVSLGTAHEAAHQRISARAPNPSRGIATTLVTAIVRKNYVIIANTGDSRATIIGNRVHFRTTDHSYIAQLIARRAICPDEACHHPMRNVVTHSLGGKFRVDIYETHLKDGEYLLLSSDGLHTCLSDDTLVTAGVFREPDHIAQFLVQEAGKISDDNITAIVYCPR